MIDIYRSVVELLDGVSVPVVHERFIDDKTSVPCVSYSYAGHEGVIESDSVRYSTDSVLIKIYTSTLSELIRISQEVDDKMSSLFYALGQADIVSTDRIIKPILYRSKFIYEARRS